MTGWLSIAASLCLSLLAFPVAANPPLEVRPDVAPFLGHPTFDAAPVSATFAEGVLALENGYLHLALDLSAGLPAPAKLTNKLAGKTYNLHLLAPQLISAQRAVAFDAIQPPTIHSTAELVTARVELGSAQVKVGVVFSLRRGDHFWTQQVTVENTQAKPLVLDEVWPEQIGFDAKAFPERSKKSTSMTDVAAYLSGPDGDGVFTTLDFIYSQIEGVDDGRLRVGYPPVHTLAPGAKYTAHPLVVGIFTAKSDVNPDSGAPFAFLRWVSRAYPPRFEEPLFLYHGTDNNTRDGRTGMMYSCRHPDATSYLRDLEAVKETLRYAGDLGMNLFHSMEEPFAFIEGKNPDPAAWAEVRKVAEETGVKLGVGPISTQGILTPLNNPYLRPFAHATGARDKDSWFHKWVFRDAEGQYTGRGARSAQGQPGRGFCMGADEFARWFEDELVHLAHVYGFQRYNYDVLVVNECFDTSHGHPAGGPASIYRQLLNLTKIFDNVRRRVPGLVWDTNLGFIPLHPKIVKHVDGIYPTDPHGTGDYIALNGNLVFDEARRQAYTTALTETGLPPAFYSTFQYFLVDNSIVRHLKSFQYQILQILAFGPNMQFGRLHHELDDVPHRQSVAAHAFLKKWIGWTKENYRYLATTRYLGEGSTGGHLYAHVIGDRGFLFLVNPNYWSTDFTVHLDQRIGLLSGDRFALRELHPESRLLLADRLPWPSWGDAVRVNVEPMTVSVLEVGPAPEIATATLVGLEGAVEQHPDGVYRVRVTAEQGEERPFAVLLPPNERPETLQLESPAEVWVNTEKQLKQPPAELREQTMDGSTLRGVLRFPRVAARPELRRWSRRAASGEDGLDEKLHKGFTGDPLTFSGIDGGAPGGFGGAYLENIFHEAKTVELTLKTRQGDGPPQVSSEIATPQPAARSEPQPSESLAGPQWFSTSVTLPFVQTPAYRPAPHHHLYLVLLLHRHQELGKIRVWINGAEAPVRHYAYHRVKEPAGAYYVDGTDADLKSGDNSVVIYLEPEH